MSKSKLLLLVVSMLVASAALLFAAGNGETESATADVYTASGYPVTTEKITLEMVAVQGHKTYAHDGMKYFDMVEEETNIHIEWRQFQEEAYPEKKNLIFASGDLPDAFFMHKTLDPTDILTHAPQGVFAPIEDLIDEFAVNLNDLLKDRPAVEKAMYAPDGHIYSFPGIWENGMEPELHFFINKAWLDRLGLDVPQNYDEYREALRAFKTGDPNGNGIADEIPLSFKDFAWMGLFPLFSSFGVDRQHQLGDEMGISIDRDDPTKVIYVAADERYKEGIKYFSSLWEEGLIDIEAFSHSYATITAKVQKVDPPTVGSFLAWSHSYIFGADTESEYLVIPPMEGPAGRRYPGDPPRYFLNGFTVTSKSEYPEAAVRWQDLQYEPTWMLQSWFGIIGEHILPKGDGTYIHADVPAGEDDRLSWTNKSAPRGHGTYAITGETYKMMESTADQRDKWATSSLYAPYIESYVAYPVVYMRSEENDEIVDLAPEIHQYGMEMGAKWITQGGIDEDWDGYIRQLNNMGLPRLIEIYQNVYDRYLGS